jgi:hypothetical protein
VADLRLKVAERESLVARLAEELKAVDAEMAAEKRDYAERRQAGEKDLDQLHRQSTECTEKLTIAANMRNNRKNVERALSEAAAQMKKLKTARNPFEEQKAEKDTKVRTLLQSMAHIKVRRFVFFVNASVADWSVGGGWWVVDSRRWTVPISSCALLNSGTRGTIFRNRRLAPILA